MLFAAPLLAAPAGQQTLFNFVRPTDVVKVATQDASLPQYNAEQTPEGEVLRRITFNPAAEPSLVLSPQTGAWDWSQFGAMSLRIQSAMDWALTLYVKVQSNNGKTLVSRIDLPAGPAQTLLIPLQANSPLSQGMKAGPPMPITVDGQRVLLASSVGEIDRSQVVSVTLSMIKPNAAQSILLERFGVQDSEPVFKAAYSDLVDAYGQSSRARWPEKVSSDEQLKTSAAKEQQQLKGWLAERDRSSLDKFGGWNKGPAFDASGFSAPARRSLVPGHPEGHPFYSLGVNTVAPDNSQTYVAGREWMFAALPKAGEPFDKYYGSGDNRDGNGADQGRSFNAGRWYDFYGANLQRTYGQPCVPAVQPAGEAKPSRRRLAPRKVLTRSAGSTTPWTACKPGVSIPSATGARLNWARLTVCLTPCHCRSSAITPASAPVPIGGAACRIHSTHALPWPPSVPWRLPPVTIATILG